MAAAGLTLLASVCRWALDPLLDARHAYSPAFLAVLAAALLGGIRLAVPTAVLSLAVSQFMFAERPWTFSAVAAQDWLALGFAAIVCAILIAVTSAYRRVGTRVQRADDAVRQSAGELARSREREEVHRTFVEQVKDHAIFRVDLRGKMATWNEGVHRLMGYEEHEFIGRDFADLFTQEDVSDGVPQSELAVAAQRGQSGNDRWMRRRNGTRFWAAGTTSALRDPGGRLIGYTKVMRDLTQQKQAEDQLARHRDHLEELVAERTQQLQAFHEQLRNAERMASIGTLSAGLGHDMGNLLLPLRLRLDSMERRGLAEQFGADLRAIRTSAEYLQRLSNGLRQLAMDPGDAYHEHERTDLATWWVDVLPILKNALPRGVSLRGDVPRGLLPVKAARHALTQAVFNLVQNAGDALRGQPGGAVSVWAQIPEISGARAVVELGVTDNGPGMSTEVKRRCLEPFFTTKSRSISTGLGLALVHGIMQQVGGSMRVESAPGQGSTIVLQIPAAHPDGDARHGVRPRATVSLRDQRLNNYVGSVLRSLDFDVRSEPGPEHLSTLWVTEGSGEASSAADRFLRQNTEARVVAFGGFGGTHGGRVIELPTQPRPGEIWQALRTAADAVAAAGVAIEDGPAG